MIFTGAIIKETLTDESLLDLLTIEKVEIWKTQNAIKYWMMILFRSDAPDFPEQLSKAIINGAWFADLKAQQDKCVIFKDTILKYAIGNAVYDVLGINFHVLPLSPEAIALGIASGKKSILCNDVACLPGRR